MASFQPSGGSQNRDAEESPPTTAPAPTGPGLAFASRRCHAGGMLDHLIRQIETGPELTPEHVAQAVSALTAETIAVETKAAFLTALAHRGERPAEIAAFARELRALSVVPPVDPATRDRGIVDVCGTGGDRLNTFNISTAVGLVVASAGVPVAKHGNRAVTSKSGSADVLQALGIPIELSPEAAAEALRERGFAFFFAPKFHPAFRHLAAARRLCAERGQRTIFNFLGPLLNPARPAAQLMGVADPSLCEPLARVLQELGVRRAMVVCGRVDTAWLDELSTLGDSTIAEFHHERGLSVGTLAPGHLPIRPARLEDLAGGDAATNAGMIRSLLAGTDRGPRRDAILLNAGAALFIAGRSRSITEGWDLAGELIDSGRATEKLRELQA